MGPVDPEDFLKAASKGKLRVVEKFLQDGGDSDTCNKVCVSVCVCVCVSVCYSDSGPCPVVSLSTLRGEITMEAQRGIELVEMVGWFLDGLRERSACALALHDAYKQGNNTPLTQHL